MVRIELLELTEETIRYKYFPEQSEEYGIVALGRKTGDRTIEKASEGYSANYAAHALRRIEEYQKEGDFPKKDIIAWY